MAKFASRARGWKDRVRRGRREAVGALEKHGFTSRQVADLRRFISTTAQAIREYLKRVESGVRHDQPT